MSWVVKCEKQVDSVRCELMYHGSKRPRLIAPEDQRPFGDMNGRLKHYRIMTQHQACVLWAWPVAAQTDRIGFELGV